MEFLSQTERAGFQARTQFFGDRTEHYDIVSFAKNFLAVGFKLDYISNYIPDFFLKVSDKEVYIVETKGLEELDIPLKIARLRQWCEDLNAAQTEVRYDFVYVDEVGYKRYRPKSFGDLVKSFREYKD